MYTRVYSFGNQGIIYFQQCVPKQSPILEKDENTLQLLDTNEELSIELVEGNIQDATVIIFFYPNLYLNSLIFNQKFNILSEINYNN